MTNSPTVNCLYWKSDQRSCMIDSWKPRLDLRRRSLERGLAPVPEQWLVIKPSESLAS